MNDARARWETNPFFVLELAPDCSRAEVERAAQKLLSLLALGASAAKTHPTPFGPRPRDEDKVRAAAAELRDPAKRVAHELWARIGPSERPASDGAYAPAWPEALRDLGWRAR